MFRKYTVENTVAKGINADVFVNGHEIKHIYRAIVFGPFVVAFGVMTDTSGKAVLDMVRGEFSRRLYFGFGRVVLSEA